MAPHLPDEPGTPPALSRRPATELVKTARKPRHGQTGTFAHSFSAPYGFSTAYTRPLDWTETAVVPPLLAESPRPPLTPPPTCDPRAPRSPAPRALPPRTPTTRVLATRVGSLRGADRAEGAAAPSACAVSAGARELQSTAGSGAPRTGGPACGPSPSFAPRCSGFSCFRSGTWPFLAPGFAVGVEGGLCVLWVLTCAAVPWTRLVSLPTLQPFLGRLVTSFSTFHLLLMAAFSFFLLLPPFFFCTVLLLMLTTSHAHNAFAPHATARSGAAPPDIPPSASTRHRLCRTCMVYVGWLTRLVLIRPVCDVFVVIDDLCNDTVLCT